MVVRILAIFFVYAHLEGLLLSIVSYQPETNEAPHFRTFAQQLAFETLHLAENKISTESKDYLETLTSQASLYYLWLRAQEVDQHKLYAR